jgi:hypothetical protein
VRPDPAAPAAIPLGTHDYYYRVQNRQWRLLIPISLAVPLLYLVLYAPSPFTFFVTMVGDAVLAVWALAIMLKP